MTPTASRRRMRSLRGCGRARQAAGEKSLADTADFAVKFAGGFLDVAPLAAFLEAVGHAVRGLFDPGTQEGADILIAFSGV